ncbi:MAG: hypothetical protein ABR886_03300 [Dehalococcoidales bacterium]
MAKKKNVSKAPREMTHRALSHHKRAIRRQRIILFGGIGVIVAVVAIIVSGWFTGYYMPLHKTVLQVYNTKFSTGYFIDTMVLSLRSAAASSNGSAVDTSQVTSSVINEIQQNELEKQAAAKVSVTVADNETLALLKNYGLPVNASSKDLAYATLLPDKMKSDYFAKIIPVSDNQVYLKAIMVEDANTAETVREGLLAGDNITSLVDQYGQGYFTQSYKGDFGYHNAAYFTTEQIPTVPVAWAFSDNGTKGAISPPLADTASYKQKGYWVIRVNDRPTPVTANVTAILVGSQAEAVSLKSLLETSDNISGLSDQYSQYTDTKNNHGELGIVTAADNVSNELFAYVTNPDIPLGQWSDPVQDKTNWTQGGSWIVQVADRQDNTKISDDDRKTLIDRAYTTWAGGLMGEAAKDVYNNFTDKLKAWAVERASKQAGIVTSTG